MSSCGSSWLIGRGNYGLDLGMPVSLVQGWFENSYHPMWCTLFLILSGGGWPHFLVPFAEFWCLTPHLQTRGVWTSARHSCTCLRSAAYQKTISPAQVYLFWFWGCGRNFSPYYGSCGTEGNSSTPCFRCHVVEYIMPKRSLQSAQSWDLCKQEARNVWSLKYIHAKFAMRFLKLIDQCMYLVWYAASQWFGSSVSLESIHVKERWNREQIQLAALFEYAEGSTDDQCSDLGRVCEAAKSLMCHMAQCSNLTDCRVPYCSSVRHIRSHFARCKVVIRDTSLNMFQSTLFTAYFAQTMMSWFSHVIQCMLLFVGRNNAQQSFCGHHNSVMLDLTPHTSAKLKEKSAQKLSPWWCTMLQKDWVLCTLFPWVSSNHIALATTVDAIICTVRIISSGWEKQWCVSGKGMLCVSTGKIAYSGAEEEEKTSEWWRECWEGDPQTFKGVLVASGFEILCNHKQIFGSLLRFPGVWPQICIVSESSRFSSELGE